MGGPGPRRPRLHKTSPPIAVSRQPPSMCAKGSPLGTLSPPPACRSPGAKVLGSAETAQEGDAHQGVCVKMENLRRRMNDSLDESIQVKRGSGGCNPRALARWVAFWRATQDVFETDVMLWTRAGPARGQPAVNGLACKASLRHMHRCAPPPRPPAAHPASYCKGPSHLVVKGVLSFECLHPHPPFFRVRQEANMQSDESAANDPSDASAVAGAHRCRSGATLRPSQRDPLRRMW
eukprot:scaffold4017_cov140-Isochrysis_galbana.AAC.5